MNDAYRIVTTERAITVQTRPPLYERGLWLAWHGDLADHSTPVGEGATEAQAVYDFAGYMTYRCTVRAVVAPGELTCDEAVAAQSAERDAADELSAALDDELNHLQADYDAQVGALSRRVLDVCAERDAAYQRGYGDGAEAMRRDVGAACHDRAALHATRVADCDASGQEFAATIWNTRLDETNALMVALRALPLPSPAEGSDPGRPRGSAT